METQITYAKTVDGVNIAYQVRGDGPVDLVYTLGMAGNFEIEFEAPVGGSIPRATRDVLAGHPVRQARHRPVRPRPWSARLRHAGGRPACRPGRGRIRTGRARRRTAEEGASPRSSPRCTPTGSLRSSSTTRGHGPRGRRTTRSARSNRMTWRTGEAEIEEHWGTERDWRSGSSRASHRRMRTTLSGFGGRPRSLRHGASPAAALAFDEFEQAIDVRSVLHTVQAPTLVLLALARLPRRGPPISPSASPVRGTFRVPGEDWMPYAGDIDALLGEIERFVRSVHAEEATFERVLDDRAVHRHRRLHGDGPRRLGDRAWKDLVERHHATDPRDDRSIPGNRGRHRG